MIELVLLWMLQGVVTNPSITPGIKCWPDIPCESGFGTVTFGDTLKWRLSVIEPAIQITVPASHPCNIDPGGSSDGTRFAVCITGPETHWTCADKSRVLLHSEDDQHYCLSMKLFDNPNESHLASIQ